MLSIKVKKLIPSAKLPSYATEGDAGLDLYSVVEKEIQSGEFSLIETGISIELPENTEAQIRPRSGLALKHGITVLNAPGTIDQGYRGEIGVILINHGKETFVVRKDMKIAQMVIYPIPQVQIEETQEINKSQRGSGGFGSSGYR